MSELDTIRVFNPSKEDFEVRYNGDLYKLEAGEERSYPQHLARHFAKHLSDKMLVVIADEMREKAIKAKEQVKEILLVQLKCHDNVPRRKALYDILKSKEEVERTLSAYPQFKGFIGVMKEYDDYVEKQTAKPTETDKN